jgi:hypothetical protein
VGVAAGTWVSFLVLFAIVRARHPEPTLVLPPREAVILVLAGLAAAAVALGTRSLLGVWRDGSLNAALALLAVAGSAGLAAYAGTALAMGHPLARAVREKLRGR